MTTENSKPQPLKGKTILVMEDDHFISKVYSKWFQLVGADVVIANDGALGLRALKEQTIDLIILDLGMPGLNGFDTLTVLKSNSETKDIPVIVLSNTTMDDNNPNFSKLKEAGVTDILRKYETSLSDLVICINRYFPSINLQNQAYQTVIQ